MTVEEIVRAIVVATTYPLPDGFGFEYRPDEFIEAVKAAHDYVNGGKNMEVGDMKTWVAVVTNLGGEHEVTLVVGADTQEAADAAFAAFLADDPYRLRFLGKAEAVVVSPAVVEVF